MGESVRTIMTQPSSLECVLKIRVEQASRLFRHENGKQNRRDACSTLSLREFPNTLLGIFYCHVELAESDEAPLSCAAIETSLSSFGCCNFRRTAAATMFFLPCPPCTNFDGDSE
jgi:hypothetical protein